MNLYAGIFIAMLLLVAAAGWRVLSTDRNPALLQEPSAVPRPGDRDLSVDLPPIGVFSYYYGSDSDAWSTFNPFIPLESRLRDAALLRRPREPRIQRGPQPEPRQPPPNDPPAEPTIEAISLPNVQPPLILGALERAGEPTLLASFAGELHILQADGQVGPWAVERIGINSAWLINEAEQRRVRLAIGMTRGDTGMQMNNDQLPQGPVRPDQPRDARNEQPEIDLSHPLVQEYLRQNPDLVPLIRSNPQAAQRMIETLLGNP